MNDSVIYVEVNTKMPKVAPDSLRCITALGVWQETGKRERMEESIPDGWQSSWHISDLSFNISLLYNNFLKQSTSTSKGSILIYGLMTSKSVSLAQASLISSSLMCLSNFPLNIFTWIISKSKLIHLLIFGKTQPLPLFINTVNSFSTYFIIPTRKLGATDTLFSPTPLLNSNQII